MVEAWRTSSGSSSQPACLALSRQALPTFDRARYASAAGVRRGAYVLADAKGAEPDVILIGTGSEVSSVYRGLRAARSAKASRRASSACRPGSCSSSRIRRIATACCRPDVTARVSVEMGSSIGWDRYVGPTGTRIGMQRFGASAPLKDLLAEVRVHGGGRRRRCEGADREVSKGIDVDDDARRRAAASNESAPAAARIWAGRSGSTSSPGGSSPRAVSRSSSSRMG